MGKGSKHKVKKNKNHEPITKYQESTRKHEEPSTKHQELETNNEITVPHQGVQK